MSLRSGGSPVTVCHIVHIVMFPGGPLWTFLVAEAFLHYMAVRHFAGAGGGRFLMEDFVRTNPTSTLTVRDYADAARPDSLKGLSEENIALALEDAERRGMDLARRLGVDRSDRRLPVYIWAIVFGEKPV